MTDDLYGFRCEYCDGTVRQQWLEREVFNHTKGVVILTNVPIGVCDCCHAHYFAAPVLKKVEAVLNGTSPCTHTEPVPVATF